MRTRGNGYSLWLMPDGMVAGKLGGLIRRLSEQYQAPVFPPHVTLLGSIPGKAEEVKSRTRELAREVPACTIRLTRIKYEVEYFRSLYVVADKSHEVMHASDCAREVYEVRKRPDYMPHLSLLYARLDDKTKEAIIKDIGWEHSYQFIADTIHLYSANGKVGDWFRVCSFPLK